MGAESLPQCRLRFGQCSLCVVNIVAGVVHHYSNQNCVNGVESGSDCPASGVMDQVEEEVYKRIDEVNGEFADEVLDQATVIMRDVRGQIESYIT